MARLRRARVPHFLSAIIAEPEMLRSRFTLLLLLASLWVCEARWPRSLRQTLLLKTPPKAPGASLAFEKRFTQKLDHFNSSDARTWQQRYFVNDANWEGKGGPVFLQIWGESPADAVWLQDGMEMMVNARKYGALAILLEHRYYGDSHPTENVSLSNLRYLSSRQALQDVVSLKAHITQQYSLTRENKWVAFGGSYAGALAAWLRLKHPDTVVGSVATSAPVLAKVDFREYLEVVNASLATSEKGVACVNNIDNATKTLDSLLRDKNQWQYLSALFHLKRPLMTMEDVHQLAQLLTSNFMDVVQYNKVNAESEGSNVDATIDTLCDMMCDKQRSPLESYVAVSDYFMQEEHIPYWDASFADEIAYLKRTEWAVAIGVRQWWYQICTEFGYFPTTDSPNQPFGDLLPLGFFTDVCSLVFNISTDALNKSIAQTNAYYRGKNIPKSATNIVFPNGSIDPWHALGITHSISAALPAVYINGTAHCANMYPPSPEDPQSLVDARIKITGLIGTWLETAT